jgi:hypothetical protein
VRTLHFSLYLSLYLSLSRALFSLALHLPLSLRFLIRVSSDIAYKAGWCGVWGSFDGHYGSRFELDASFLPPTFQAELM